MGSHSGSSNQSMWQNNIPYFDRVELSSLFPYLYPSSPWSINSGPYYSHTVANRTRLSAGFTGFFSLFSNRFKAIKFRLSWFEKTFYFAKTQVFWRLGHTAVAYNISFSVSWTVVVATIRSFSRKCLRSQIGLIGSFAISLAVFWPSTLAGWRGTRRTTKGSTISHQNQCV